MYRSKVDFDCFIPVDNTNPIMMSNISNALFLLFPHAQNECPQTIHQKDYITFIDKNIL